jgi:hypothetical protein
MKRIIVDYNKLTNEILTLLLERFPDGYDDSHIIRFRNAQNELIEAVEVRTEDTIYLVKVSTKLASRLEKFDDDIDDVVEPIDTMKDIDIEDEDAASDEEEEDIDVDKPESEDGEDDDDDDDDKDFADISEDDDEDEDDEK